MAQGSPASMEEKPTSVQDGRSDDELASAAEEVLGNLRTLLLGGWVIVEGSPEAKRRFMDTLYPHGTSAHAGYHTFHGHTRRGGCYVADLAKPTPALRSRLAHMNDRTYQALFAIHLGLGSGGELCVDDCDVLRGGSETRPAMVEMFVAWLRRDFA